MLPDVLRRATDIKSVPDYQSPKILQATQKNPHLGVKYNEKSLLSLLRNIFQEKYEFSDTKKKYDIKIKKIINIKFN